MSYKFDSLLMILTKLDTGEKVTCRSLMDDLEISERSAYRYITSLQVAGFPIYYDRKLGSYTFTDGFSLNKPQLNAEEALSLALAKQMIAPMGGKLAHGIASIEDRLSTRGNSLPPHIVLPSVVTNKSIENVFSPINAAISTHTVIKVEYRASADGNTTSRVLEPLYLFARDNSWYVRAYCRETKEIRTFGLDLILELKLLSEHFIPREVSPEDELSGAFGSFVDGPPTEVILHFDRECVSRLRRKNWHSSQQQKQLPNGGMELRFTVNGTDGIKRWLYGWAPYVEVMEPVSLRAQVRAELEYMLGKHSVKDG